MGKRAPPSLSIVGSFFPLPWLAYAAGTVAPDVCHLALVAAPAPLVVIREDAQRDSRLATIPGGLRGVELDGMWPRCGVREQQPHDGRSDSPVR